MCALHIGDHKKRHTDSKDRQNADRVRAMKVRRGLGMLECGLRSQSENYHLWLPNSPSWCQDCAAERHNLYKLVQKISCMIKDTKYKLFLHQAHGCQSFNESWTDIHRSEMLPRIRR